MNGVLQESSIFSISAIMQFLREVNLLDDSVS